MLTGTIIVQEYRYASGAARSIHRSDGEDIVLEFENRTSMGERGHVAVRLDHVQARDIVAVLTAALDGPPPAESPITAQ